MTKSDRIIYGTPALERCGQILADFILAYDFEDERAYYIKKFLAEFYILKLDIETLNEFGIIKTTKDTDGEDLYTKCSLNSYTGLLKNHNDVHLIRDLDRKLNPKWKKYIHMDWNRLCYNANPGYGHTDHLVRKYKLKSKKKHKSKQKKTNYYEEYKDLLNELHEYECRINSTGPR